MTDRFCRLLFFVFLVLTQVPVVSAAQPDRFHNALSLQGFTGVLNIPNAHVTDEGWLYALYNNQVESQWRNKAPRQDNYEFSIGFFKCIELGGRFFEAPRAGRDLSANVKVTSAPFTPDIPYFPVFAAGMQDVSGGAAKLQTSYLVVSEDLGPLRLSAGYGRGPDRMKGPFGGAELKLHDFLYLLGEYDTSDKNVGARLVLPQFRAVPVSFTATAKTSLSHQTGNFDIAVGLTMPLDFRMKKEQRGFTQAAAKPVASGSVPPQPAPGTATAEPTPVRVGSDVADRGATGSLDALRAALVREGFLNVRVGALERTLVVEYENVVFNHNELDALGVVTGLSCRIAPASFEKLAVVIKRRDIAVTQVTAPLADLRAFLRDEASLGALRDHLVIDSDTSATEGAVFVAGDDNWGGFNTSFMLAPALTTYVGTEVGVFDYYLALKPELNAFLWKGAAATARWNVPVSWSENLEPGGNYQGSRQPGQLDRLMLFQAVKLLPEVTANLGAGMVAHDRYGMLNEAVWQPGRGEHRFRVVQGWTEDAKSDRPSDLLIGAYRFYYHPLDLFVEAAAGKFWAEDKGGSLEVKRYWEDTSVTFYGKATKGVDRKAWQSVGIQFTFPLTPRRDMKPIAKLQLRGTDEWAYSQETTLENNNVNNKKRGSLNYLAPYPLAINPQPTQALYRSMYNKDRLNDSYIRRHLDRLRDGWLKYGSE